MVRSAVAGLIVLAALAMAPAQAADVYVKAPPTVLVEPPPVIMATPVEPPPVVVTGPLRPEPQIRYGCHRIWRCDTTVCEWRRGCWGIYGYMEGPYYTKALAERQWESHGWPMPAHRRFRGN